MLSQVVYMVVQYHQISYTHQPFASLTKIAIKIMGMNYQARLE